MSRPLVRSSVEGHRATITLDVPATRNALSEAVLHQLHDAVRAALADDGVRCLVLTGAGSSFCAGADMREHRERHARGQSAAAPALLPDILLDLWHSPKPVIGRVNGSVRAAGMSLVGACDIVISDETASFSFSEVRVGVAPAVVSVTTLPRMAPRAGLELMLTGEVFDATRAVEVGLVNRAVPTSELDAEVDRYLDMLQRGAPLAIMQTKNIVRRVPTLPMTEAFAEMGALSISFFGSAEGEEGMRAFLEHRAPSWANES